MRGEKVLRYREDLEEIEIKTLAPYAVKSRHSFGREFPEEKDPYRTEFQRDWNRLIHTEAFRKLEFKTQVLPFSEAPDTSRNRLTHSIEVEQISNTIARCLGLNEDLVRALSLSHDFGHPPFGHSGEDELRTLLANYQSDFNHNRHGLKIARELEKRDPGYPGLNLTREVLEGFERHRTPYDVETVSSFIPGNNPGLECQIVNLADLIAYSSHDLDDAMQIGVISPGDLKGKAEHSFPFLLSILGEACGHDDKSAKILIVRDFINHMMMDVIEKARELIEKNKISSVDEVRSFEGVLVSFSDGFRAQQEELRKYIKEIFYNDYRVVRMDNKGRRIIRGLFSEYYNSEKTLPPPVQKRLERSGGARHEIIADYIAGMTDREAVEEYKRIFELSGYQKEFSPV